MSNKIQLYKNDLPDDLNLGNIIAVDGEFMGLNVRRDPLCLIQISSGNSEAHIVQFDRENYKAPNLVNLLNDENIVKIQISFFKKRFLSFFSSKIFASIISIYPALAWVFII